MLENSELMKKDVEEIVESLCFSRLTGSAEAEKAEKIVMEKFSSKGIALSGECFEATTFWVSFLLQVMMGVAIALTLLMVYVSFYNPVINVFISVFVIIIAGIGASAARGGKSLKIIGKKLKTCNFIAEQNAKKENPSKTILFMAHHDSKGQPLTTKQRSVFFTIGAFGLLLMAICFSICGIFMLLFNNIPFAIHIIGLVGASVVIICCIPLLFNGLTESSPGTLDNASGIAALYVLAQHYKNNPLDNTKIIFLITGAEELAMLGARVYLSKHSHELDKKSTFIINFDMIGRKDCNVEIMEKEGLIAPKSPSEYLASIAKTAANNLNIKLDTFTLPIGGATDRGVFTKAGFQGIEFINKKAAYETHSAKDCLDNFDSALAIQFIAVANEMAKIIDKN